jgi:hypothetical protein
MATGYSRRMPNARRASGTTSSRWVLPSLGCGPGLAPWRSRVPSRGGSASRVSRGPASHSRRYRSCSTGAPPTAAFAEATLRSAPPNAVLFVAGDNDTYPLWYAQAARGIRRDVTVVTIPLLGARWYRAEMARRAGLYHAADTAGWQGMARETAAIGALAERGGRPVATAVAVPADQRSSLGRRWALRGLVYVKESENPSAATTFIDVPRVDSTAALVSRLFPGEPDPGRVDDPAARYAVGLMACPGLARDAASGSAADSARLLASRCNFR